MLKFPTNNNLQQVTQQTNMNDTLYEMNDKERLTG